MVQDGDKWLWVKMWWNLWIQVVTGAYTWLRVVMGGFGVGTRWVVTYLIFVTDTTDGVCVKKIARCKFLQI